MQQRLVKNIYYNDLREILFRRYIFRRYLQKKLNSLREIIFRVKSRSGVLKGIMQKSECRIVQKSECRK